MRLARSVSSIASPRAVDWRTIATSTSAWSRSRCASSSADERKDRPARNLSTERNGRSRALTTILGVTHSATVDTLDESRLAVSNSTSSMTKAGSAAGAGVTSHCAASSDVISRAARPSVHSTARRCHAVRRASGRAHGRKTRARDGFPAAIPGRTAQHRALASVLTGGSRDC